MAKNKFLGMKIQYFPFVIFFLIIFWPVSLFSQNAAVKSSGLFRMPKGISEKDYVPFCVIFKVKDQFRPFCSNTSIDMKEMKSFSEEMGLKKLGKIFPEENRPESDFNASGLPMADLSLTYELEYKAEIPIQTLINRMYNLGFIEYAQPRYIPQVLYTPNDPLIGSQSFLTNIQAQAAWNISKGDTSVVIGIVDTGTDPDHPDLAANLKKNYADPIDGIDNDNDGYVDNFRGWDLGENDNDATVNANSHGSHVSGCAAAVTDNAVGVASPGFNCRFLPIKISDAAGTLSKGYEGIKYAADHGCAIINCSWGGSTRGDFEQSVINYASVNKNCLVVAAAGNNGIDEIFYPAAYNYVLAVASTSGSDAKSSFSNYGAFIDVCAPGSQINSTWYNNTYSIQSGTSMASPIVAGGAALVKSYFPSYTGLQLGEQLRISADDIYNKSGNSVYAGKLGKGRINLFKALTFSSPSIKVSNLKLSDGNDDAFIAGDTIQISASFTNFLIPTSNLSIQISTSSSNIIILNSNLNVGVLNTLSVINNIPSPFLAVIKPATPLNDVATFTIKFTDGTYTDSYVFDVTLNVDYINLAINEIATTISSKGRIAYNGLDQTEGLGFRFNNGNSMVYEMGLMLGKDLNHVSDNMRGAVGGQTDNDFVSSSVVYKVNPMISLMDLGGNFNDNNASVSKLNVSVRHKAYAWKNAADNRYVIVEYFIKNMGMQALNSLYAGIFSDWDIMNYSLNNAAFDPLNRLGYAWSNEASGIYGGIELLTPGNVFHYAFDNDGANSSINLYGGFPSSAKFQAMTVNRLSAGLGDVSDMVSTGPFYLGIGDSICVAFALLADSNLNGLQNSAAKAQDKYNQVLLGFNELENNDAGFSVSAGPNPVSNNLFINIKTNENAPFLGELFNSSGQKIMQILKADIPAGTHQYSADVSKLTSGVYYYSIKTNKKIFTNKIVIIK